jgi:hypothetical protein
MKYNLAIDKEAGAAMMFLAKLTKASKIVEVKEVKPRRSLNQNSFIHLLLGIFSVETGNKIADAKDLYKWVNQDIYYRKKKMAGEVVLTVRSSADLTKEEMTKSIERFREWSAEHGYPLPTAEDKEALRYYENQIEQSSHHL